MSRLYASPLRVYLCLGMLAIVGIYSGLKLPVSLFPNSSKPIVTVRSGYGSMTAHEYVDTYGRALEDQLRSSAVNGVLVQSLRASYDRDGAEFSVEFPWGVSGQQALREVSLVMNSFGARLPEEIRDSMESWIRAENSGFIAVSFFSSQRSLDEVYDTLEPVIMPLVAKIRDAEGADLYNPSRKEIRVELSAERMATLQLVPRDIERAIDASLSGFGGGSMTVGARQFQIQMTRPVRDIEDLKKIIISTPTGRSVHLSEVAHVDRAAVTTQARAFKTNGAPSLILFATPKPGGNVKTMSEEMIAVVKRVMVGMPKDIEYRVLVDPSEFIRAAVNNVFHEVAIGALLAVAILFLFIGSFKNTVTAAIEIPMSMILAFILMRMSDMNMNLISLGGLALSAGMNVDASVVVMENIFRHFEENKTKLDARGRLLLLTKAVSEVRFAVIASTIASLVVFLPLAFTSDLSYAILGDLAKTVVFSHGLSAIVALVLVPTVRLQLMEHSARKLNGSLEAPVHSPIERHIRRLEESYGTLLGKFIQRNRVKRATYLSLLAILGLLVVLVLPRLPREVIGKPDTDWMVLSVNTKGNTLLKQMEAQADVTEAELLQALGSRVAYTFVQIRGPNNASVMARLKDKGQMRAVWKELEEKFTNTPFLRYWIGPWNPAELPIPDPPQLRLTVRGGTLEQRSNATDEIAMALEEAQVLPRIWAEPSVSRTEGIILKTDPEQWAALRSQGSSLQPGDLADIARVATAGRRVGRLTVKGNSSDIVMRYPDGMLSSPDDLRSLPIGTGSKLVSFGALARVTMEPALPVIFREDGRELFSILGRENESAAGKKKKDFLARAQEVVGRWTSEKAAKSQEAAAGPRVYFEDAEKDLTEALHQLGIAVALSVALIFLTLLVQFGDVASALLVLVAVPLGFIGVMLSLFAFGSTLSLNSILGVILLNGISVANSIILVDFMKRLVDGGMAPEAAAVEAARKRLRPILITSLTTILGMMPIALGFGEGGRILQPLGIAVSGGLWVSMGLTLFLVPALQVSYLSWKKRRQSRTLPMGASVHGAESGPTPPQPAIPGLLIENESRSSLSASAASAASAVPELWQ